jgi:hypothetical protein
LFPVVIATVFLTIIGISVGLALAAQARRDTSVTQQPAAPVPAGPDGPACRSETQQVAKRFSPSGTLVVVLRVRTASAGVWICSDGAGRLYYHANRGGPNAEWIENRTALFLPDVVADGDGYRATATDAKGLVTTFSVNRQRLLIKHGNGRLEKQPVVAE